MKRRRVLSILLREDRGNQIWGAQKNFLLLAKQMSQSGAEVSVVEYSPAICRFRDVPYRTLEINRYSGRHRLLRLIIQSTSAARTSRCEVLYAYTVSPDFEEIALVSLSTALLLRKPLYVSVNDDKGRSEDEKPLHKLMAEGLHSRNGLRSTLRSVVFHNARRVICRIATASFVTTPLVADFARDVLGARRVLVVGRGLGEAWISQDWKKDTHKEYDASYLGRIDALKGIDSLLDGWKCVVTERKDARLLLIGDGDRLQEAKTRVREAGMELNVTFAGYVADEEQIRKMLRSSRMFVFLSRKEGFANAVAQAMSCALPCVLSDIPELKAVYGQSAIYVDPHDPRALSESILGLLYDRNKSRYYGESGRRLVEKLTWARTGDAILAAMQLA